MKVKPNLSKNSKFGGTFQENYCIKPFKLKQMKKPFAVVRCELVCFFLFMVVALLIPCGAMGQNGNFTHQSFGSDYTGSFTHQSFGSDYLGYFTHQSFGSDYTGSFTHQSFGSDYDGFFSHQSFGSNYEGGFTHQSFGGPAPMGSGLLVLLTAGMGYAAWKRKKQQINKEK